MKLIGYLLQSVTNFERNFVFLWMKSNQVFEDVTSHFDPFTFGSNISLILQLRFVCVCVGIDSFV